MRFTCSFIHTQNHLQRAEPCAVFWGVCGGRYGTAPALMELVVHGEDRWGTHVLRREVEYMLEAHWGVGKSLLNPSVSDLH